MRPHDLAAQWYAYELPTVEFYGHSNGSHRVFSNFYEHAPYRFQVPEVAGRSALIASGRSDIAMVSFSEKAIMLCKAAAMQDYATFDAILRAQNPKAAKALGRQVAPWNEQRWESVVCEVALAAVSQKFEQLPNLAAVLLATGNRLVAEMTRNDRNWGTGLDVGHPDGSRPARWRGTNILGWALMQARAQLAASVSPMQTSGKVLPGEHDTPSCADAVAVAAAAKEEEEEEEADGEREGTADGQLSRRERKAGKKRRTGRLQSDWLQPNASNDS